MQAKLARPIGVTSLVITEILTAILLLLVGVLMIDAAQMGLTGAGLLANIGAGAIIVSLLSFVAALGFWRGMGWAWTLARVLSIVTIITNAGLMALAVSVTGAFLYPGLAVVLFILVNDAILAELAVVYFQSKPEIRAFLGKGPRITP